MPERVWIDQKNQTYDNNSDWVEISQSKYIKQLQQQKQGNKLPWTM